MQMSSTNVHRTNAVWHNNTQKHTTAFSSCSLFTSCQRVWCCAEANLHVVMKGLAPCDMCHIWINVFLHFCFSAFKKHVRVITTNICYTSEKKRLASLFYWASVTMVTTFHNRRENEHCVEATAGSRGWGARPQCFGLMTLTWTVG